MTGAADARAGVTVGPIARADRDDLAALLQATGQFREAEVEVALELLDAAFAPSGGAGRDPAVYAFVAARDPNARLDGFACWGRTPQTRATCDLYWLAVHPRAQRHGVGAALILAVHAQMRSDGARCSIVEASGRPDAAPARVFYERQGYRPEAVVRDFYAPGDDRVSYVNRFPPGTGQAPTS